MSHLPIWTQSDWFVHHTLLMHVQVYEAMYIHGIHSFFSHHSLDRLLPWMYSSDEDSSIGDSLDEERQHQHVRKMMFMAAFTMANIVATAALIYADPLYNKLSYHTSALSDADWVWELISSHPGCICNELGVHKHVFCTLVEELQLAGHGPSKHVYLEEQLAIFLYTCVTGLSFQHVCEHFQHSGDTVSK